MPLRFDLSLSPFGAQPDDLIAAAQRAESAGFDCVWVYDHLSGAVAGADWTLDPWVTLTAIANATQHIQLGPLVLNAPARHPAHVALAAATLQRLSDGRLLLGMGAGAGADHHGTELAMVGIPRLPAALRRQITAESIEAVRALWAARPFDGEHFHITRPTAFLTPGALPPFIVGANGPKMVALAADLADGVNLHSREEDLESLCSLARSRTGPGFLVTVEAPLTEEWIAGKGRRRLDDIGVDRVMYRWRTGLGIGAIEDAATALGLVPHRNGQGPVPSPH